MNLELNKLQDFEILNENVESLLDVNALESIHSTDIDIIEARPVLESETLRHPLEEYRRFEVFEWMKHPEVLNDADVTESIADALSQIEVLKYENWIHLSLEQRKSLLNLIEARIAEIQHRPPLSIQVEEMDSDTFGYQSPTTNSIGINSKYVLSDSKNDFTELLDTIIHEGRHAYQHYNVDKVCIHSSASVVNTWRENFYDPKHRYYSGGELLVIGPKGIVGDVGGRLYEYQPVEIDARDFAMEVIRKLRMKGFFLGMARTEDPTIQNNNNQNGKSK